MNRMWSNIIKPIIEGVNANYIVEVGSNTSINTLNMLEYCVEHNAHMKAIDPFPNFDIDEFKIKYGDKFEIYEDFSLNILPTLENCDVILLDSDHNWYTVYNELKIIEKTFKKFPIVFLHNICWPFGRRDFYSNPDNIPEIYRQPYEQFEMYSDQVDLNRSRGIDTHFYNSINESNSQNGVLTAIEDFIAESDLKFSFKIINAFHGLGILYPNDHKIDAIIKNVINNPDLVEKLEEERVNLIKTNFELKNQNSLFQEKLNENELNLEHIKYQLEQKENQLKEKENQLKISNQQIQEKQKHLEMKDVQIKELNSQISIMSANTYEMKYTNNIDRSMFQRLISKFPSLYILLKKTNKGTKQRLNYIKGYRAIKKNNLLDIGYYFSNNEDVIKSGMDPILHYMYYGFKEGRRPNSWFDGDYYLKKYSDVQKSGLNPLIHYSLHGKKENRKINKNKISVIVTSYNHEKYIEKCIDSILMQKGDFELELILGDDNSQDNTRKILEKYQKKYPQAIYLFPEFENMGVTKNLKRCFKVATGDYIAICEGDDYWIDPYKLQKQANFLDKREDCALCFNSVLVFYENGKEKTHIAHRHLNKDTFTVQELILDNFIGNFSCCMYRTDIVKKLPDNLYDFFTVDWMFNMACSEYGNIGFLKEPMSAYRKHSSSLWSNKDSNYKKKEILKNIEIYNEFFSFKYDYEFKKHKEIISKVNTISKKSDIQDIIIFDDLFPHPLSAFRFQEYNSYLEHFNKIKIYSNGISLPALTETKSIESVIGDYEKEFPQFNNKVKKYDPETIFQAKVIYTIFLNNIYSFIDTIEKYGIPFAFTLYPGGGFYLNDKISDEKLKRVLSSPHFKKVIVTQKVTYNYLINNDFCKADQIKHIFGGVAPLKLLEKEYNNKKFFGKDKSILDICFVAQKYTEKGEDKGYDVFIDVAHQLAKKYNNIQFHVVGGFDDTVLDITSIKNKINFYGLRVYDWFEEFYKDKDIILSPNIPFKLMNGAFDGFPTGCCTDAGVHKVAIFCTDELNLNTKYKDGEEIVIVPHDSQKIVEMIEKYYKNPDKLQEIAEKGCLKIKEIYNYENQIMPRIKILEEIIKDQ